MTSWEKVHGWYDKKVGDEGHYYHQAVVIPGLLELLKLKKGDALLDLGCGQGVLSRAIPASVAYTGIDISKSLIHAAKTRSRQEKKSETYLVADITKPLPVPAGSFSHAACVLALQNVGPQDRVFQAVSEALKPKGVFVAILNHPCFRIPRQTSWGYDEKAKVQYRRLDRYLSPLEIPILMHPGKTESLRKTRSPAKPSKKDAGTTFSYHYPISYYASALSKEGLYIEAIEEWCSDKESEGGRARAENRARKEFPLFMAIKARKL